jgi:CRISPR/Cas system-associated exonuclease Cas4 (RecB family)
MRTIRASEIGTYLYCQRAWWYQKRGETSQNLAEMAAGSELHYQHGRAALTVGCLRLLAYALILATIILLTIYFTPQFL